MANTIEYAKIFQEELDKAFVPAAVTGWMDANAKNLKYRGGNEIKIPSIVMQGLGNYDRNGGGAPEGDITFAYETMTMTQDRGRGFTLDEMDVDETNFVLNMGAVMGEFQRTRVVPEIDAYRLSTAAKLAGADRTRALSPTASNILTEITKDILAVQEKVGYSAEIIVHISGDSYALLINNDKVARYLNVQEFTKGDIKMSVKAIDGNVLIPTSGALMKTKYKFNDGKTAGQEEGGFAPDDGAKNINWIVFARSCPIAVSRQDAVRVFDPNTYQKSRAWHADYRRYHDLWIPKHKLDGVFVNTAV